MSVCISDSGAVFGWSSLLLKLELYPVSSVFRRPTATRLINPAKSVRPSLLANGHQSVFFCCMGNEAGNGGAAGKWSVAPSTPNRFRGTPHMYVQNNTSGHELGNISFLAGTSWLHALRAALLVLTEHLVQLSRNERILVRTCEWEVNVTPLCHCNFHQGHFLQWQLSDDLTCPFVRKSFLSPLPSCSPVEL